MTNATEKEGIEIDLSTNPMRKAVVTVLVLATLFGAGYAVGQLLATVF